MKIKFLAVAIICWCSSVMGASDGKDDKITFAPVRSSFDMGPRLRNAALANNLKEIHYLLSNEIPEEFRPDRIVYDWVLSEIDQKPIDESILEILRRQEPIIPKGTAPIKPLTVQVKPASSAHASSQLEGKRMTTRAHQVLPQGSISKVHPELNNASTHAAAASVYVHSVAAQGNDCNCGDCGNCGGGGGGGGGGGDCGDCGDCSIA